VVAIAGFEHLSRGLALKEGGIGMSESKRCRPVMICQLIEQLLSGIWNRRRKGINGLYRGIRQNQGVKEDLLRYPSPIG
jgi:hypothetical protein